MADISDGVDEIDLVEEVLGCLLTGGFWVVDVEVFWIQTRYHQSNVAPKGLKVK